jgi:hypothetical protein
MREHNEKMVIPNDFDPGWLSNRTIPHSHPHPANTHDGANRYT